MAARSLTICAVVVMLFISMTSATSPGKSTGSQLASDAMSIDNTTFIDANNILMFVTNHGNFGRDVGGVFGYDFGTWWPFGGDSTAIRLNEDGAGRMSPLYAAGLWMAGRVGDDIHVAIAEYIDEYVPGPMASGTYLPDDPSFKVYKLYEDSLESNPNAYYLDWPVSQGAPVNAQGKPVMIGDQLLWTVYNDADPDQHINDAGETDPLGIEVQQTVWAYKTALTDTFVVTEAVAADHVGPSAGYVEVTVADPSALTSDQYRVVFKDDPVLGIVWNVEDITTDETLLENQTDQSGQGEYPVVDGLFIRVVAPQPRVVAINEVATASGPLDPPEDVMGSLNSTGDWYVGSTLTNYNVYGLIGTYDWEFRFTSEGSQYYDYTTNELVPDRAPFEVWNIGIGTPDDPSDDVRINFSYVDFDFMGYWSYGDRVNPWEQPYVEPAPFFPTYVYPDDFRIGRIIFYDYSGETSAPAEGTIVRFVTEKDTTNSPADTFTFMAPEYKLTSIGTGEANSLYIKYKLYNKGYNTIDDFYIAPWMDPDLGTNSDDLAGCDTLNDIFFCYNANSYDLRYGGSPPAIGFKILKGPLVASSGDTAYFDDNLVPDMKNMNMTSFLKYINGTDPDNANESYNYIRGLYADGSPYVYDGHELKYMYSGDPVAGVGDLDNTPVDLRLMAGFGPLKFYPGDSQYVFIKMVVAQSSDRLASITKVKESLSAEDIPTAVSDDGLAPIPDRFIVSQNYPNPFNPSTTVLYSLPKRASVTVDIYNILGQRVRTLIDQTMPAGNHSAVWDGADESGKPVSTGLYFYRVKADDRTETRKMLLIK